MATPKSGYALIKDIAYGDHPRQVLDIYKPHSKQDKPTKKLPILLFVHGGSWQNGSKDDYLFLGESFSKAGYVVVVINYRLAPEFVYPAFVEDSALAIGWVHTHAGDYDADAGSLFVMGHSAGAFNAIAAVDNPQFFKKYNIPDDAVKAVVGISGPYSYDFSIDPSRIAFPLDVRPIDIMPFHHVRANPVPHLLLLAAKDTLVHDFNTFDMAEVLKAQGGEVAIKRVANTGHISIIAAVSSRLAWSANTKKIILRYLSGV